MNDGRQGVIVQPRNRGEPGLQEHTYPPNRRSLPGQGIAQGLGTAQRLVVGGSGAAVLWYGLRQGGAARWASLLLGSALIYQGASGQNLIDRIPGAEQMPVLRQLSSAPTQLRVRKTMTINRPAGELYQYWRNLENLPTFMHHVRSVRQLDDQRSHWVVDVLDNMELEWDAQITVDRPNEMIAWETMPDASLQHKGYVKFIPTARGTEVSVSMDYDPPGEMPEKLMGGALRFIAAQQIKEEIRNFKRIMEAGEIPTTKGQPAARREAWEQSAQRTQPDLRQPAMQGG